jgi:hypothetical protein
VTFTSSTSGGGQLTLQLSGAYQSSVSRTLVGTSGSKDRALLTVNITPSWLMPPLWTAGLWLNFEEHGEPINVVVSNRGGAPTTTLGVGAPLPSPILWGLPGGTGFPGGSGVGLTDPGWSFFPVSVPLPYCGHVVAPGEQCLIGFGYSAPAPSSVSGTLNLAYADATGPAVANVNSNLQATFPADAGTD